jgi:hypothetical protein
MAEDFNEIDSLFKQRFEGLRDYSIDPQSNWTSGQSSMSRSAVARASSGVGLANMAAALVSAIVISSVFSLNDPGAIDYKLNPSSISFVETISPTEIAPSIATESKNSPIYNGPANDLMAFNSRANDSAISSTSAPLRSEFLAEVSAYFDSETAEESPSFSLMSQSSANLANSEKIIRKDISLIPSFKTSSYISALVERIAPQIEDPTIEKWDKSVAFFFKGGIRSGTGESNSFETNAEWKINLFGNVGVGYALSSKSYVSAEIGLLRRSGNGIERTRKLDVTSLITAFNNHVNSESPQEYVIHESLIATKMDYVHIPVSCHFLAFEKADFLIGGFADVLISAQNEAYIVYDNEEYKVNPYGKDLNTMNGLKRIRYGIQLGYEHSITNHISGTFVGMMPLNLAVDESSGYGVFDQANKPIDVQLALKYRL